MVLTLAVLPTLAPSSAWAQAAEGGRHGGRRQHGQTAPAPSADAPTLKPEPVQRLDPGAMLCSSEAALQQHQAAILARLNGAEVEEPTGCRIVQHGTAVAVLERHGQSHTEVRVPGPPEQVGWTDTMVRNP